MPKRVLDLGNCSPDHAAIAALLGRHFDVELHQAHDEAQAAALLAEHSFNLVLVNRVFDRGGQSGMDFIRELMAERSDSGPAVMLISNYAESQDEAVSLGALPGFGKAELHGEKTLARLRAVL